MNNNEWTSCELGKVLTLQRGFDLPYRLRSAGTVPIVTSSGISDFHSEAKVAAPGIVTGRYGTIGEVFYVEEDFWPHNTTLYVRDFKGNNPLFLSYLLRTIDFQSHSGKSGVPGVNRNDLHKLPALLPPLPEQEAIAEALADVDALLAALDKLIAKKRAIKQAAMQQLLTGKTRLPGFTGEWKEKPLRDLATITMGQSPPSSFYNFSGEGLPLIQGNADIDKRRTIDRVWTTKATKVCETGDLIVTVRAPVGAVGVAAKRSCIGRGVCGIKPQISSGFLFQALILAEDNWRVLEQGSTFTSANSSQVSEFTLLVPIDEMEQVAIATVLSDMDAEIMALERRRDKTQQIKQGMMQQLLTGRIRLVNPSTAEATA